MARRGLGFLWWHRRGLTQPGGAGNETEEANGVQTSLLAQPAAAVEEGTPAAGEDIPEAVGPFGEGGAHCDTEAEEVP